MAVALVTAHVAAAQVRQYWVQAVPVSWNLVPNGHDAMTNTQYLTADTVFPTVVYERSRRTSGMSCPTLRRDRATRT